MEKFSVHKWNADRREAALNEGSTADKWYVIYTSPRGVNSKSYYRSEEEARKMAAAVHSYEEKGWQSTVMEPENLNEGALDVLGNGVIKIMDYAFFTIMADNEEAFNLLMDTLKNATNEEKVEMLTNLAKFRLKPTLMKLAQAELANMSNKQDQLRKAFREE